jgi:hypothetical protein
MTKKTLRMAVLATAIASTAAPVFACAPTGTNPRPQASYVSVLLSAVASLIGL